VAGLGIGGLAVALAVRPTLENLIGGIILYLDKPVRVGDFCSFGDKTGTIESIGLRSTKLRALDRTLVTIPNAALADMQVINWAKCDRMLISTTIGLRYETDSDQLRYIMVEFREMLHTHPNVDSETVRVRFAG
jgi:MscS family membrane protein